MNKIKPLIRLTKKQRQELEGVMKGMTLTGAMALAGGDSAKFQANYDHQMQIIHALRVLGISVEVTDQ